MLDRLRSFDMERALGLRPVWPRVALELDGRAVTLVRIRKRRRGAPLLEAHRVCELAEPAVPSTVFDANGQPGEELGRRLRETFEVAGVRPGRVSVVLPDNLARIALLSLPERPSSRRQLLEIIRFKMHRAVPFRFSEAEVSFQLLPHEGAGTTILVALIRRTLVERYEQVLSGIGARAGLLDLCTPNLINLCRARVDAATADGDVALLNCTTQYFSLVIVRKQRLIFYRCKNHATAGDGSRGANGMLTREVANSFSYYEEKLGGRGIGTILVRSVGPTFEELSESLAGLGVPRVEAIDPLERLSLGEGLAVAPELVQRIAPAVGAVVGRG